MVCLVANQKESHYSNTLLRAQFISVAGQSNSLSGPLGADYAMWDVSNSIDGLSNCKSMNQIPHSRAKSAHSEMRGSSQQSLSVNQNVSDCHANLSDNMQNNGQKKDSRYGKDMSSSHNTGGFMPNNANWQRNIGGNSTHSNSNYSIGATSESMNSHNKGPYGAQFNNQANRPPKNPAAESGYCGNGNNSSPYAAWPGLNSTSVSSSNGWNFQNNVSRKGQDTSSNSSVKDGKEEENMSIDGELSYSDLIGATGGAENVMNKQGPNGGSWGGPRLGAVGNPEGTVNSSTGSWNSGQGGPMTNSSNNTWDNRQMSGPPSEPANDSMDMMNSQGSFPGLIGATGGSDIPEGKSNDEHYYKHDGIPPRLGLLGGGEGALNAASSGWSGSVPSSNSNSTWGGNGRTGGGNCDIGENNGSGMSPPKPHHSWAQAAGKGLNPHGLNGNGNGGQGPATSTTEQPNSSSDNTSEQPKPVEFVATEHQIRAAKSEGWGQTPVNQDTPWDVPPSPPPAQPQNQAEAGTSGIESGAPVWRQTVNNGTDIWQNNLRLNKGAPSADTSNTPPWGHTPATNIGGHWGDDDSGTNTWSGVNPMNTNNPACWAEQNPAQQNAVWSGQNAPPPVDKQWGGGGNGGGGNGGGNMAGASWNDGNDSGTAVWNPPLAKQRNVGGSWSPAATPKKDMQPTNWEMSPPQNRRAITGGNFDDGTAVWGNPQRQGKVSNWKDMPPAKQIMNSANGMNAPGGLNSMPLGGGGGMGASSQGMIRFPTGGNAGPKPDMGAPWNRAPSANRNPGWQDMPSHDGPNIGTWGEDPIHMCNPMKNSSSTSNSSVGGFGGGNNWNEQNNSAGYWGPKPKGPPNWSDGLVDTTSWLGPSKQGAKPLTRDLIWSCKQFRMLNELGYKKEDVENALRNNNMNFEEAFFELRGNDPSVSVDMDNFLGRKVRPASANISDDISMAENVLEASFGGGNFHGGNNFQSSNFQNMGNMGPFKPQMKVHGQNNASNVLGSGLGGQNNNSNNPLGNFNLFQKILQQQNQQQQSTFQQQLASAANMQLGNQGRGGSGGNNSNAYLRNLVQQIQMAIHAGHLNPQILSNPLAPQTLQLLFQLLQQIRVLSQLQQQQLLHGPKMMTGGGPNNSNATLQLNVQVTHTKQRILNLQNQIAAQQAVFLKTQISSHPMMHSAQNNDIFKPSIEPMPSLQSEFRDMSLKEVPLQTHQQSRLIQWKLSTYEKEDGSFCGQNSGNGTSSLTSNNEFIRAPGPLPSKNSSSASSSMPNNGPNLHPLLSQGDSTWSSLSHSQGDSGWPEPATSLAGLDSVSAASVNMDSKEQSNTPPNSGPSTSSASYNLANLSDLVPEFEPGKPWKGTQLKNIEDDPHITPGSITRSPLSVNTIKDPDLFWNAKSSPAASSNNDTSSTLASNTWNFQAPQTSVANSSSATGNKSGGAKWSTESGNGSDVWGTVPKSRGPPPGIGAQGSWDRQNSFTFLLLRNLTPQIDGSTLKTLCMQHGPLQLFHLSLNHGIALVRYSSREEASKAQSALNNCVLGNTTILADIPNESEVQQYSILLTNQNSTGNMGWQASGQQSSVSTAGYRSNSTSYPFDNTTGNNSNSGSSSKLDSSGRNGSNINMPSSQIWSFPNTSNALWSSFQPLSDHEPNSNSSLNRFLPDNLLGGESM